MAKSATIRDVAKKAGVSIATVSFVMNDHPTEAISDAVKKRVLAAAKALQYHPNAAAARLASKRTKNIAIVFYEDEGTISNQFYSFVIQGVVRAAMERQYNLLFSFVDGPYRGYSDLPKVIREKNADGVLFIQRVHRKMIADIQKRKIPVVCIDHYPPVRKVHAVRIDNELGGRLAAEHFVELGHETVGVIAAEANRPSISQRIKGFEVGLSAGGGCAPLVIEGESLTFEAAYESTRAELKRHAQLTGLFCVNDEMAAGVLRAAHEVGRNVPEDLSVIGFDDIAMSSYTDPPLTTIGVDKEGLGERAVGRLIDLVQREDDDGAHRHEAAAVELVVRESTCGVAKDAKRQRR